MSADLQINGLTDIQRKLAELPRRIANEYLAKAMQDAADVIAKELHSNAVAIEEPTSSSKLCDHIVTSVEVHNLVAEAHIGFDQTLDEKHNITQDLKAFLVEFGHKDVSHEPNENVIGYVPAHPFMRPSVDASRVEAIDTFYQSINEALDKDLS